MCSPSLLPPHSLTPSPSSVSSRPSRGSRGASARHSPAPPAGALGGWPGRAGARAATATASDCLCSAQLHGELAPSGTSAAVATGPHRSRPSCSPACFDANRDVLERCALHRMRAAPPPLLTILALPMRDRSQQQRHPCSVFVASLRFAPCRCTQLHPTGAFPCSLFEPRLELQATCRREALRSPPPRRCPCKRRDGLPSSGGRLQASARLVPGLSSPDARQGGRHHRRSTRDAPRCIAAPALASPATGSHPMVPASDETNGATAATLDHGGRSRLDAARRHEPPRAHPHALAALFLLVLPCRSPARGTLRPGPDWICHRLCFRRVACTA